MPRVHRHRVLDKQTLLIKRISKIDITLSLINIPIGMSFLSVMQIFKAWNNEKRGQKEIDQDLAISLAILYFYISAFSLCCFMSLISIYVYLSVDMEHCTDAVKRFTKTSSYCSLVIVSITSWMFSPTTPSNPLELPLKWGLVVGITLCCGIISYWRVKRFERMMRKRGGQN